MARLCTLASGSKGNSTYISSAGGDIIVDAGISYKLFVTAFESAGGDINRLQAIAITHTHTDHIKGLKVFCKKYNTLVYFTSKMQEELNFINNYRFIDNDKIILKDLILNIIKTSHDVADSVGYVIEGDNRSIVYITDTGYINNKYFNLLENREVYILESNYDIEMLNNGPYSFSLRQRILGDKGHLSNYDCSRYLSNFIGDKTDTIILAHLSHENNTRELAYDTLINRLNSNNKQVRKIIIAKQDEETEEVLV